jgi:hypothetical protein
MRVGILVRNTVLFLALFVIVIFLVSRRQTAREDAPDPTRTTAGEEQGRAERQIELVGPSTVSGRNTMGENVWEAGITGKWHVDEVTGSMVGNEVEWRVVDRNLQQLEVTAGTLKAAEASEIVHFADGVEATLPADDATVTADEADYDPSRQQLTAAGNIVMRWREMIVTGQKLTADMVTHKIRVHGEVRMTYEG